MIGRAAHRVAARADVPPDWLNDAVKGYLSPRGDFDPYLDRDHLKVFVARYFDAEWLPPKTRLALEKLVPG